MRLLSAVRLAPVESDRTKQYKGQRGWALGVERGREEGVGKHEPARLARFVPAPQAVHAARDRPGDEHVGRSRARLEPPAKRRHQDQRRPEAHARAKHPRGQAIGEHQARDRRDHARQPRRAAMRRVQPDAVRLAGGIRTRTLRAAAVECLALRRFPECGTAGGSLAGRRSPD